MDAFCKVDGQKSPEIDKLGVFLVQKAVQSGCKTGNGDKIANLMLYMRQWSADDRSKIKQIW